MTYGVFGLDKWIIDCNHVDLTVLDADMAVSTPSGYHAKDLQMRLTTYALRRT